MASSDYPYVWAWRRRTYNRSDYGAGDGRDKVAFFGDGVDRAGQRCRVLARGAMNSALIEFEDGYLVNTGRGGLRKAPLPAHAGVADQLPATNRARS